MLKTPRLAAACTVLALALAAAAPARAQRTVEFHIIGFDVDANTARQLQEIANAGGGSYHSSTDEAGLTQALGAATGVDVGNIGGVGGSEPATVSAEQEDNNTIGTANPVAVAGAVGGAIDPKGDADWYRLDAVRQGELAVKIDQVAAELDIAFRVWNGEFKVVQGWIGPKAKGGETVGSVDLRAPGRYAIEVRDGSNDAGSAQPYRLNLGFTATEDEHEPNDDFASAALVGADHSLRAAILPKGDADWYMVHVDRQGALTIALSESPDSLDLAVRVWNDDYKVIKGWVGPKVQGGDTVSVVDLPAPGFYRIEVRDGSNDARDVRPYRLTLSYQPTGDEGEPNQTIPEATALGADAETQAAILPKGDVDYYRVDVADQGELSVTISEVPKGLDMSYRVWTEAQKVLAGWLGPKVEGGNTEGWADLPKPGSYFLEVRDGSNDARSADPYKLGLKFKPTGDAGEPNQSISTATPLDAVGAFNAAILPQGDVDYYRFEATDQGALTVRLDRSPAGLDLSFRVWNDARKVLHGWVGPKAKGGETEAVVDLPAPGAYYLEVRDGSNDARSPDPYRIRLEFAPTGDAGEPNNTIGMASALPPSGSAQGSILPKGDADWYRFRASAAGLATVRLSGSDQALDLSFRVWDREARVVHGWTGPKAKGGETTAEVKLANPGEYYVEVRDGSNDARAVTPYTLTVAAP